MDKKAMEAVWWIIITFVILAVVAVIIIVGFKGLFTKEKKIVESQIEGQCFQIGSCKDDCAEDEKFIIGLWKDCTRGQVCCAKRAT